MDGTSSWENSLEAFNPWLDFGVAEVSFYVDLRGLDAVALLVELDFLELPRSDWLDASQFRLLDLPLFGMGCLSMVCVLVIRQLLLPAGLLIKRLIN